MVWLIIPNIIWLFDLIFEGYITLDISYIAHVYLFMYTVSGWGFFFTVGGA